MTAIKRSDEQLDYDIDFERWLDPADSITDFNAYILGDVAMEIVDAQMFGMVLKVWLNGGTEGATYTVVPSVTTANGRIKEEPFRVRIRSGC